MSQTYIEEQIDVSLHSKSELRHRDLLIKPRSEGPLSLSYWEDENTGIYPEIVESPFGVVIVSRTTFVEHVGGLLVPQRLLVADEALSSFGGLKACLHIARGVRQNLLCDFAYTAFDLQGKYGCVSFIEQAGLPLAVKFYSRAINQYKREVSAYEQGEAYLTCRADEALNQLGLRFPRVYLATFDMLLMDRIPDRFLPIAEHLKNGSLNNIQRQDILYRLYKYNELVSGGLIKGSKERFICKENGDHAFTDSAGRHVYYDSVTGEIFLIDLNYSFDWRPF